MTTSVEHDRFAPASTVSWNDVGDELTLFDSATQGYFALNGGAVAIWRELAAGKSPAEVTETLAARFDGQRDAIASDVAAFVRDAIDRGLLIVRR
jgi:hypothetical protein